MRTKWEHVSSGNEIYSIAPGEGKHPIHFMKEKYCEELAFPTLFPTGQFGYQVERDVPILPVKYFNARLLNYTGRFDRNPEYLFFAQYITEQKKSTRQHKYSLEKVQGKPLTVHEIKNMDQQTLQNLIFFRPGIHIHVKCSRITILLEKIYV